MPIEGTVEQAADILTITDVTIIGVLLAIIFISWFVIWQLWKSNNKLNDEVRGFIEKYYTLSTRILSYISKGTDV